DGDWKLLRPAIFETLMATPADIAADENIKREWPDDIDRSPLPTPGADAEPVALQLYDVAADPGEQHDLAAAEPARVARMEADLIAWFEDVTATLPPPSPFWRT